MLINSKKILKKARDGKYAIGAFNTSDLEITQAILEAANELKSPVIVQTSEKAIDFAGLENLADMVKNEAKKYDIPVVLHLDHGRSIEIVKKCLDVGYTSVMFDGSKLEFGENVRQTQNIVRLAKKYDASVEAEIGHVGHFVSSSSRKRSASTPASPAGGLGIYKMDSRLRGNDNKKNGNDNYIGDESIGDDESSYTDPKQALQFVQETGVDSLAIAFGNAHGVPDPEEKLNFEVLEKIAKLVKIPLVFHGASSTPVADMKKAISLGIAKVNIDTDIRIAFSGAVKEFIAKHPDVYDPREIMGSAKEAVRKVVEKKIALFSMK